MAVDVTAAEGITLTTDTRVRSRPARPRRALTAALWYVVLISISLVTILPFVWMLLTSLKGPQDPIFSVPPQFFPAHPTLDNYVKVLDTLPILSFFRNSIVVALSVTVLSVLVTALAAYPLAKMRFRGREAIFYLLLGTLIVPVQLTYIPSFVLAVNVFHYDDTLFALILPNLASAFNIFLMRQAFKGVPNDLIEAARIDGAREIRIWWSVLLPIVRPTLATVAIFTFVLSWNDFLWPSLMLHTREGMTLPVGLAALQGLFSSDFRSIAAGVTMTIIPILHFLHRLPAPVRPRARRRGEGVTEASTAERSPAELALGSVMLAFDGLAVPPDVAERLLGAPAAGVTLFRFSNVETPAQVRALTAELQAITGAGVPLLIAADQEGGQLNALGDGVTPFAGNMALGAAGDPALTERVARATGLELRAMGVTIDYAPVCDLATNPRNPAVGIRSFGDEPARVGEHVAAFVRGLQSVGVAAGLKHFPGLGGVVDDTHHRLAVLDASWRSCRMGSSSRSGPGSSRARRS